MLMVESAKRVVFKNCLGACEVDTERFKYFNKDFYYNMKDEQKCLESCFNNRMIAHFGEQRAKTTDGLQINFAILKHQYKQFEKMHPDMKKQGVFWSGEKEDNLDNIISKLREKSNNAQDKFNFN